MGTKILTALLVLSIMMGGVIHASTATAQVQIQDRDRDAYCLGDDPHPAGQALADEYGVPYEDIKEWYCTDGYGMGEIENALWAAAQTGLTPDDVFDLHDSLGGWGRVWQELDLIGGGPDESTDPAGPFEASPSGNEDPIAVQIQDRDRDAYCIPTQTQLNPGIQRLVADYDVPYEELIPWFCAGYGIGEIENALWTAQQTGMTLEEIFDMHDDLGGGWGQLWLELNLVGKDRDESVDPGKGDYCLGSAAHAGAERLEEEFGVPYDEIMAWFCEDSYGYGEVKIALTASLELGIPADELLSMKDELGSWGKVWQELGLKGKLQDVGQQKKGGNEDGAGGPGKPETPGKPDQPGNPEKPAQPAAPGNPEAPAQPEEPGNPDSPGQPAQPGEPNKGSSGKKNG